MSETVNKAAMAELLAKRLFSEFFWSQSGPMNQNWPCEEKDSHGVDTHPCDVVFYYDEPYSANRTYVHCDLKSYSKASITTSAVKNALKSLALQVSCAEKSDKWRSMFTHGHKSPSICGMLFIYNHDGAYDKEFSSHLSEVKPSSLDVPKDSKLVVLGPKQIHWLNNVSLEIQRMRGNATPELPAAKYCSFYHPQLNRRANVQADTARAATLETLTSPLIILEARDPEIHPRRKVVTFYAGDGSSVDEFIYLIDIFRKYNFFDSSSEILVKSLDASEHAAPNFAKAQQRYTEGLLGSNVSTDLTKYVDRIRYSSMTDIQTTFSETNLGM